MKKVSLASMVTLLLVASSVFAISEELIPVNGKTKEYPARFASNSLRVANFDAPVTIIADSGKTIRIISDIPFTVAIHQHKGQMWIVGPVKVRRANRGASVSSGAAASSQVHQKTHGKQSPCVSGSGNVTINYGDGSAYKNDEGIVIKIPKWIHVEADNIFGDLVTR